MPSIPHRIIIAEDYPDVRAFLEVALARIFPSSTISAVADGVAALVAYDTAGADLILTDHHMPGLSGLALARMLRAAEATCPIVLMTGGGAPESAQDSGVTAILHKPVFVADLKQVLQRVLAAA
jgi:CheY-like chemotaxis protein